MNCIYKPNTKRLLENACQETQNLIIQEKQKVRRTGKARAIFICQKSKENCVKQRVNGSFSSSALCLDLELICGGAVQRNTKYSREKRRQISFTNLCQFLSPPRISVVTSRSKHCIKVAKSFFDSP